MTEKRVKVVFFTGAGISAESGLKTFRDSNGLWENYKIEDVATPEAWNKNKEVVLQFYNLRRKQAMEAFPNKAHKIIAELESLYDIHIITQNVDDLHERAGSKNVLHLHGELMKSRSTFDENLVYTLKNWELNIGDICEKGSQLRPHIVWFGEAVPEMDTAISIAFEANVLVIIGTSLNVYPAAGIAQATNRNCFKYLIDPSPFTFDQAIGFKQINKIATEGIDLLADELKKVFLKF